MLNENPVEHFSFIQEEESDLGLSYMAIMTQIAQENTSARKLQDDTNDSVESDTDSSDHDDDEPAKNKTINTGTFTRSMDQEQMYASTLRNIMIFLPITLAIILYFVVMSLVDMSVQKNSILYAKYGTTKQLQGAN
jgi:hypothetical protein